MRLGRSIAVATAHTLMAACSAAGGASDDPATDPTPATAPVISSPPVASQPIDPSSVTPPGDPGSTTPTVEVTTTSTTAMATTTSTPSPKPTLVDGARVVASIGFFGDSLIADLTAIGGRDNQVVPQLAERLTNNPELDVERVENLALPGQSVVSDLELIEPEKATIRPFVERLMQTQPDLIDLAVIAISSSDINLNASLPDPVDIDDLAADMLTELSAVESAFRAADVEVVFLPIFGINDTVFLDLRCAMAATCPAGPDRAVESVNRFLWDSDLPMLFASFDDLDEDGDGRTDRQWFDDVDPRYPDDGVHPNAEGQLLLSSTVYDALNALLS